ncbi:RNA methyltransferase [bacterium]|nr:RNA methyltransferase [bacterium]
MMKNLRIVLVRPKYARNVGMAARAMSNYGAEQLILIEPRCALDQEAREGASHAQTQIQKAMIYPHWQRFYDWEPEGIRIAFSARDGKRREAFDFASTLKHDPLIKKEIFEKPTYLIFGPEDHGLADSDLDFVHRVFQIKLPGENPSMNLSHAVMSVLTLLHQSTDPTLPIPLSKEEREKFFFPDQTLKRWLEALNIDISLHEKVNSYTVLKRLLLKGIPTTKELQMLETVLQQTIRKLKRDTSPDSYRDSLDDTLRQDKSL